MQPLKLQNGSENHSGKLLINTWLFAKWHTWLLTVIEKYFKNEAVKKIARVKILA